MLAVLCTRPSCMSHPRSLKTCRVPKLQSVEIVLHVMACPVRDALHNKASVAGQVSYISEKPSPLFR